MTTILDVVGGGDRLTVAEVDDERELAAALGAAGVPRGVPVLVLVGGAAGLAAGQEDTLASSLGAVAEMLDVLGGAVVDGGTDAGVMRRMGRARRAAGARFPLVGVAAGGTVALPGRPAATHAATPEWGHTHLVLVPGDRWGDEAPWLALVATTVAADAPSVTLLVDGGEISYRDVEHSLAAGRPVLALDGSGRAADDLAAAVRRAEGASDRARRLVGAGTVAAVPAGQQDALVDAVRTALAHG